MGYSPWGHKESDMDEHARRTKPGPKCKEALPHPQGPTFAR